MTLFFIKLYKFCYLGYSKSNIDTDIIYSVLFDEEFPSGMSFGGSGNRVYKLCKMSFINLSHAIRNGQYKPLTVKVEQNSNFERQVSYLFFHLL